MHILSLSSTQVAVVITHQSSHTEAPQKSPFRKLRTLAKKCLLNAGKPLTILDIVDFVMISLFFEIFGSTRKQLQEQKNKQERKIGKFISFERKMYDQR